MPAPDPCPTAGDLGKCLRGELSPADAARVEEHVGACHACQAALEQVTRPAPPPLGAAPEIPGFTLLDDGRPIGEGGMGEVFRAIEVGIGREVAVKIIHRSHATNPARPKLVRRFEEEVKLLGRIQHSGVPPVYRFGWVGDDQPYLVMRLIPWPTLGDELAADWAPGVGGPTPDRLNQYLVWFSRACEAVGYAHDHGAVHLDLKPANVKVHRSGEVQVLDWGLGRGYKATPEDLTRLFSESLVTQDGGPIGHTAAYSPPEQVRGGHPNPKMHPRADVFALGSVLCEVLTGRPAFAGATPDERFNKAWNCDLTDARARLAVVARRHPLLSGLALRCLEPDPADRPADAGLVAAEVRRIILSAEDRLRSARWRFRLGAIAAATVVLAAATAGWVAYRESEHERSKAEDKLGKTIADLRADALEREIEEGKRNVVEAAARGHLAAADTAEGRATDPARDVGHPVVRKELADDWATAVREATAAGDAIRNHVIEAELNDRVEKTTKRLKKAADAFGADRTLLDALDVVRARKVFHPDPDRYVQFSGTYFYSRAGVEEYPKAFQAAELPLDATPDRVREFIGKVRDRSPAVRRVVVAALDQWYLLDRTPDSEWLLDVADALDDDRLRARVRKEVLGGHETMTRFLTSEPGLASRLTPEAALLAAAALEEWARPGPNGRPAHPVPGTEDAAALLRTVAKALADRGADPAGVYWVNLTLGFYLWNAAGRNDRWESADEAVTHLRTAEVVAGGPKAVRADDPTAIGVLRAAAGGFRAYAEARRARPTGVARLLKQASDDYPGYWPTWQLSALVRLDQGDATEALRAAEAWQRHHPRSELAKGYAALAKAVVDPDPKTAARGLVRMAEDSTFAPFDQLHLAELRDATDPLPPPTARRPSGGVLHPLRPGRDMILVVDARARLDRALDPCRLPDPGASPAAAIGFRPWEVVAADGGGRVGRAVGEEWAAPLAAVEGYGRALESAPWASGPQHGMVRAKLAAGQPGEAAYLADRLAAVAGAAPRPGLYHVYRARLHHAAADWAGDARLAQPHRERAAEALRSAVAADPQLAPLAAAVRAESTRAQAVAEVLTKDDGVAALALCDRADEGFRLLGPGWLTARLAARPFVQYRRFADDPFADAAGREAVVARAAVLAAWGCQQLPKPMDAKAAAQVTLPFLAVPPDPRLDPQARTAILRRVREWADSAIGKDALTTTLADPVMHRFVAEVGERRVLPTDADPTKVEPDTWEVERMAWVELLNRLKDQGHLPRGVGPPQPPPKPGGR